MQLVCDKIMQDEVTDASTEDESNKGAQLSEEAKLVSIDIADITNRYQDVCPLGSGANALIFSAIDQQTQRRIAVKKVTDL